MVRSFLSDYERINRENRKKAAVKALEDLGYIDYLEKGNRSIHPQSLKPNPTVIELVP